MIEQEDILVSSPQTIDLLISRLVIYSLITKLLINCLPESSCA